MDNRYTMRRGRSRERGWLTLVLIAAAAAVTIVTSAPLSAQCVGDCDGGGTVAVNELVRGVNIVLEVAPLDTCPSFDVNDSGAVEINELVQGVNNLLGECPPVAPTATPTPPGVTDTPTPSRTPTPTCPMTAGECGTGVVDFDLGETCDDCNTSEGVGDRCPADCRVEECSVAEPRRAADVSFAPPGGIELATIQVFVRYPDGVVRIRGEGNEQSVVESFSNQTSGVNFDYNEQQNFSFAVLGTTTGAAIPAGRLFTVNFETCEGPPPPTEDDFTCEVVDAASTEGMSVAGVTCSLTLP